MRAIFTTTLMLVATPARANDLRFVYYDVTGNTARQLRRELNAKGPMSYRGRVDGLAQWSVTWKYHSAPTADGCEFTEFRAKVEGTITLPRWTPSGKFSPELMNRWQNFLTALRIHEHGHYSHGEQAAREIQTLGRRFRVTGNCSSIAQQFNDQAMKISDKYRAADKEYDRRTRFGWTQGVKFP